LQVDADVSGSTGALIGDLRRLVVLRGARTFPGLLIVAVLLLLASAGGGYALSDWYPAALFLLGLLVVVAVADGSVALAARSNVVAVAIFGAFAAWSLLSVAWANAKDDAWDGGNRVVAYFVILAILGLAPSTPRQSAVILGAFSGGVMILTGATFLFGDPGPTFTNGRLAEPIGYASATAALCLMAVWPALTLAIAREVPALLRGAMLGCAAVLLQLALVAESRGAAFALPLATVVYVVLVRFRARALLALLLLGAAGYLTWDTLTDVYAGVRAGSSTALNDARIAMAVTFLAVALVGALLAFAERRLSVAGAVARRGARAIQVGVLVLVLAGAAAWVVQEGKPVERADQAWQDFKSGYPDSFGDSRLTGELGTNRYDFWRVGLLMFRDHPVGGAGADNFSLEYVHDRKTGEEPTYPHSIGIEVLSQTGIVGAVLFAAALIAAAVAYARKQRELDGFGRLVAASAMTGFVYWLLHAAVDWFWELPVLGVAAFMLLGLAMGTSTRIDVLPDRHSRAAPWARALGLVVVVAVALSFVFPWLSARAIDGALAVWRDDPEAAQARLAQARELNPLSDRPDEIAGAIASRSGDVSAMRRAFEGAVDRNPRNWYSRLELGVAYALSGDYDAALTELEIAKELNPRERVIHGALAEVLLGRPPSPASIDARFLAQAEARTR
jgi:tetratricopeptide (TPR) repeat protein